MADDDDIEKGELLPVAQAVSDEDVDTEMDLDAIVAVAKAAVSPAFRAELKRCLRQLARKPHRQAVMPLKVYQGVPQAMRDDILAEYRTDTHAIVAEQKSKDADFVISIETLDEVAARKRWLCIMDIGCGCLIVAFIVCAVLAIMEDYNRRHAK